MIIIKERVTIGELKEMANKMFGNLVKGVVDVEQKIMAIDAELHADEEAELLQGGSKQENLWGINIYPELNRDNNNFIEFDSMINLRPAQGNRSRGVENPETKEQIVKIVNKLIV